MNQGALLVGCLVLGAAGGVAASLLVAPSPAATPVGGAPAAAPADHAALDRLEARVEELAGRAELRPAPAPAPVSPAPAGPAAPSDPDAPPDRLDALEKRVAALEAAGPRGTPMPADLSKVPLGQLEALGRSLMTERRNADMIKVAEEMLRRDDLTAEQRVESEMSIGYGLRGLGKNAEAEARFRETLARVGESSDQAGWLGFQIGWERSYQKDLPGAVAEMEKAANHPLVQPLVKAHALYNAANFARQAGDTARARVLLERLLAQSADAFPPAQAGMKTQAEAWLKEIVGN
jgi:hypothetical protein